MYVKFEPPMSERITYDCIVLAANCLSIACIAANANHRDRRAAETEKDIHALDDDAQQPEKERASRRAGLS